jgi:hypothetical protein
VQSTNPLGKAMDMLQEDIESMQKELQFWTRERKSYAQRITVGLASRCLSLGACVLGLVSPYTWNP